MRKHILTIIVIITFIIVMYDIMLLRCPSEVIQGGIRFTDFWSEFNPDDNWFLKLLSRYNYDYTVVDCENPQVEIFSVFGNENERTPTNVHKVFYTGENIPPVNGANLNLTFENTTSNNNIRLPYWVLYDDFIGSPEKALLMTLTPKPIFPLKFCCFVYSNEVPYRNSFCKKLSTYKHIDCGGKCLNNIGGKVDDKIEFQKSYKFCIAYENDMNPGYTTEKIFQAYQSNCIPIYCGSTEVTDDFNAETFINAHDFDSEDDLIDYIIKVDNDDKLYKSFMNKPIFSQKWLDIFNDPNETYFKTIASKIMNSS